MDDELRDRITAYGRMKEGIAKAGLRDTLIEDAVYLNGEAKAAEVWLGDNWSRGGDENYIGALHEYEKVCDLRDQIRRDVLGGGSVPVS